MRLQQWLDTAVNRLEAAGIGTARLDCLVLLEDCLGKDRSYLLAHPEITLDSKALDALNAQIMRRMQHEPLAYIRSKTEFYGREFIVNKHVLEPRPESEAMIELLIGLPPPTPTVIVDIGTGSGALAITAKLELPEATVMATDISSDCLEVAQHNAQKYGVDIQFFKGNLLDPLVKRINPTVVLANLPYVPDSYTLNNAAMMEPRIAIFGGPDGLDIYRKLFDQLTNLPENPTYILTESLPFQHTELSKVAERHHYQQLRRVDLIQVFQYTAGQIPT